MYDYKKLRTNYRITVEDLIKELKKENPKAEIVICGDDRIYIHVEKDGSIVNLDAESLSDEYDENEYDDRTIPRIKPECTTLFEMKKKELGFDYTNHDECLKAVKENPYILMNIENQTEDICLEAVRENEYALQYVKEQTPEICMEAVKEDGLALQYVKEQTPEICMDAVKQNGYALEYVKEQTEDICLEAVKRNGLALQYVKEQTKDICLEAVKRNGLALQCVKQQTKDICKAAIENNPKAIIYVNDDILNQLEDIGYGIK